jgi:hypothetical protein
MVMTQPVANWRADELPRSDDANHDIAGRFQELAGQWKADTRLLSSSTAISSHPAYRAIIALGPPVLPFILRDLETEPAHWFEALQAITGEDPVPRADWGKIPAMRAAWLAWGRNRGLI